MRIFEIGTGKDYPKDCKDGWGNPEFWINEANKLLSDRGLNLNDFGGITEVCIGNSSYPITKIIFKNELEIFAEEQSPPWTKEENDKTLNKFK